MTGGARRAGPVDGARRDGPGPVMLGLAAEALGRLAVGPGTRLLDVHAGSGGLSIAAARRGAEVLAVDPAPSAIERLQVRARSEGLDLAVRVMEDRATVPTDDQLDVVASMHGVSQSPDLGRCLEEMVRVTRPGGRVLIVALGSPGRAEFLTYLTGAVQATVPDLVHATDPSPRIPGSSPGRGGPPSPPRRSGPFQVADPAALARHMIDVGLGDVRVVTATWELPLESASHLWDLATGEIPVVAELVVALSPAQVGEVKRVLEGMLRERSGGRPGAVLTAAVNIGTGTR